MAGKNEWLLGDTFDELRLKTRPISYTHDNKKSFRCIPRIAITLLPPFLSRLLYIKVPAISCDK